MSRLWEDMSFVVVFLLFRTASEPTVLTSSSLSNCVLRSLVHGSLLSLDIGACCGSWNEDDGPDVPSRRMVSKGTIYFAFLVYSALFPLSPAVVAISHAISPVSSTQSSCSLHRSMVPAINPNHLKLFLPGSRLSISFIGESARHASCVRVLMLKSLPRGYAGFCHGYVM